MTPLLLALALAAPVPKDFRPAKSDTEAMQGEWVVTESVIRGRPSPSTKGVRYAMTGNAVAVTRPDGGGGTVTMTLDEKAKSYTWVAPWGTWNGRYKLDGDTLTLCSVPKGKPMPEEVAPGDAVEYSVLTRSRK